ncbi:MAG: 50S ribosomal protein L2 [Candidatus Heimdallarchaeota archaeon]|nr:50S ribosomal protein L2 [Candidatus Heimdallarchaeota archaeon]
MGKRIISQKRGHGSPVYRAAGHKRISPIKYRKISKEEYNDSFYAEILDLYHEPGRGAPLAKIKFFDGYQTYILPAEGVTVGNKIYYGATAEIKAGNVLPLVAIPIRTPVFNLELRKGDGGKLVRTGGASAIIDSKNDKFAIIKLPSGKFKKLPLECRATVGIVAGGGRVTKPFLKAGTKSHARKAKGLRYPKVRGVAMPVAFHPHGGGSHQSPHKPTTISRNAPPGRKVGLIAARRTGFKRGRQAIDKNSKKDL